MFTLVIEFKIHNGGRSVRRIQLNCLKNNNLRPPGWSFFSLPAIPETRVNFFFRWNTLFKTLCSNVLWKSKLGFFLRLFWAIFCQNQGFCFYQGGLRRRYNWFFVTYFLFPYLITLLIGSMTLNRVKLGREVIFIKYLASAVSLTFLVLTLSWNKITFLAHNLLNLHIWQ